ncbi:sulfotransferase [Roseivirga sp.]|uniref:sulfotransferase n=1 Tax=Roseivirga sp. TaxID=1964215 RepID=UPI003B8C6F2D
MLFIVGSSRTASKAYMHLLNVHTHFNITRELHLHKRKGPGCIKAKLKAFNSNKLDLGALANELGQLSNASYWKSDDFKPDGFKKFLAQKDFKKLSYSQLVDLLLEHDKLNNEKIQAGAKFPMHISFFPILKNWYPKEKFIFLCRNPADVAFSQFNKHRLEKPTGRFIMLVYTAIMFNFTVLWGNLLKPKNSIFIPYELFKKDRQNVIQQLCEFLELRFNPAMLDLPILDSRIGQDKVLFRLKKLEKTLLIILTFPFNVIYHKRKV